LSESLWSLLGTQIRSADKGMFWALKSLSFEVEKGEVLGVIGENGAGKSTLLKIFSRITEPSVGFVDVDGRVGSLLEVGTGFHPELSGRDNIYLNGAILGMKKGEISAKFDEIVAFAEVERFIDTPVKHYSSGMYLRLAFAVAAHMESDILLVDEVLAVGDVAFQKRCLGKMQEVTNQGRTVLLVSHNMGVMSQLCRQVLWLSGGTLRQIGPAHEVISAYLRTDRDVAGPSTLKSQFQYWSHIPARLISVDVLERNDAKSTVIRFDDSYRIAICYEVMRPIRSMSIICRLVDATGTAVWTSWDTDTTDWNERIRQPGRYVSTCEVPKHLIRPGAYCLSVGATDNRNKFDIFDNVCRFDVSDVGYPLNKERVGVITPLLEWSVHRDEPPAETKDETEAESYWSA
jgi:lipopolysaccharide transport system ATP-binding protein